MAQTTTIRPEKPCQPAQRRRARRGTRSTLASIGTLARWQLRTTWRLLLLIGLGLLAAVVLLCAIPLYTQVSLSAGLRSTLAANPQSLYLTVHAQSPLFSTAAVQDVQGAITQIVQGDLGTSVSSTPDLSVQIAALQVGHTNFLNVVGATVDQAKSHVKLLQGRLPAETSGNTLEFVTTAQSVKDFNFQLGKTFMLPYPMANPVSSGKPIKALLHFRLVGIIAPTVPTNTSDIFWHGETFTPEFQVQGLTTLEYVSVLVSNSEVMNVLTQLSTSANPQSDSNVAFSGPPDIYWYYTYDFSHLDISHLPDLTGNLSSVLTILSNNPTSFPYVMGTTAIGSLNTLQNYSSRITVIQLPILCLAYLIAGLILFFVLLMTDVLVERQVEAIALLRSRGASARQVLGSLLTQSVALAIIAFVAGPLLAILGVVALAHLVLAPSDLGALHLITDDPLTVARGQLERDLIIVGLALLGTIVSIWRVLRTNVLVLRRESARATHKPLWMRFRLDILAAVVALAGFGFSLYIANPGVLNVPTRALILPLTSLVGVLFLLLGLLLLSLRLLPALLRLGERLAARNRGAAPVLAFVQMARAPRQAVRMTLLFALAVAFTLFALIFSATQAQRLKDMAIYQVGGDFSGTLPTTLQGDTWQQQRAYYLGIKGVTSATVGTSMPLTGGSNHVVVDVNAVDSTMYASTMYWPAQNGTQSVSKLMSTLHAGQAEAEKRNVVPALLDATAAQSLGVGIGQQVVLRDFRGPLSFVVIGIVQYLPTIYDTVSGTGSETAIPQGGMLVDFQTYSDVALAVNSEGVSTTQVWLRTSPQPTDQTSIRRTLLAGIYGLTNGADRLTLTQNLARDPLYGTLVGILTIGALLALLLGLVGNLLVSWWNARSRRVNFAVLRALGCAPGQIAGTLLWEQGLVYSAGLLLGIVLGFVFSLLIVPAFVFSPVTGAISPASFDLAQSVPPVQVIFPLWPIVVVLVALLVMCALALWLMLRVVVRPQIGSTLRVDED